MLRSIRPTRATAIPVFETGALNYSSTNPLVWSGFREGEAPSEPSRRERTPSEVP
jgi:hypothetical protein